MRIIVVNLKRCDIHLFIFKLGNYIINIITMNWKSGKHCAPHTVPLDSCFNLRSYKQCMPWYNWLEIEPVTTECRAETLLLSHWSALQNRSPLREITVLCFDPSTRPKNAIPRWYTGRKWHIPMASNRKRSRGRIKAYDMGQGEGPTVPLQWCTGRK